MDKEVLVHKYDGILAMKRNAFESVELRQINLEPVIQSELSQKEKKYNYILMHIYGIKIKWESLTYLQGTIADADLGNRLVDTGREGEGRMN